MATLWRVPTHGTEQNPELATPHSATEGFTRAEICDLLQCRWIQAIRLADGNWLLMDEEGRFKPGNPPNRVATAWYHKAGGVPAWEIVGDVIICTPAEFQ